MWPTAHTHAAAAAEDYQAAKAAHEEIAQQYRVAAAQLAETSEGAFSEAAITEHQLLAIDHRNISEIMGHLHSAHQEVAILGHDLTRALDQIDYETHQEIAAAPPAAREAIIAKGHSAALATLANFTTAVTDTHARVQGIVDPLAAGVIGRAGGPKTDDPSETTHALDNNSTTGERGDRTGSSGGRDSDTGARGDLANRTPSGQTPETGRHGDLSAGTSPGGPPAETGKRGELTNPIQAPPPLTSGVPTGLGGGSVPGGGGGIPAGGSGLGLGGANPLSAFTSGVGNVPSAAASQSGLPGIAGGSGNLPGVPAAGAGVDPSAFARGVSAGSGAVASVSPVAAPPALPSTAGSAPPAAGSAGASPSATSLPAGMAASGAHAPAPPMAGSAAGLGATSPPPAAGVMLPPPGMGGPAAQGISAGGGAAGAATVPATASSSTSVASAGSGGSASAAAAPTVVPASVVTPAAGSAGRQRRLSEDVLAAARLAWELHQASRVHYPLDWAVGVFRSPSGSETVAVSNDGSGYVPEGVVLPRGVRLAVADSPLVDREFRRRWFGWADPARVLVEYAALRADDDWRMVAAATTAEVGAFRSAGVEHTKVSRREEDRPAGLAADWSAPVLDDMHVHRLQLEYPDLYERLAKLAGMAQSAQERVIFPLTQVLIRELRQVDECPKEAIQPVWAVVETGRELDSAAWETFNTACDSYFLSVGAKRPGGYTDDDLRPEQVPAQIHAHYRGQWVAARVMEHLKGWGVRPLPLADMVYAAVAAEVACNGDVRTVLEPGLRQIEQEMPRR